VTGCFPPGTELNLEFRYRYWEGAADTGDTGSVDTDAGGWIEDSFCDPHGGPEGQGLISGTLEAFVDSWSLSNTITGGGTDRCWATFTAPVVP
jgi:hypothetical protein